VFTFVRPQWSYLTGLCYQWSQRRAQAFRTYFVLLLITVIGTIVSALAVNYFNSSDNPNFWMRQHLKSAANVDKFAAISSVNDLWSWIEGK
jgi:hypothetical protein